MDAIVSCRESISERFPVASFTVHVPEQRFYEVVCATDPRLLHTDNEAQRTPQNFYSSRLGGLLPAKRGANAFVLPADQLRRFAGARRIYYALGTYAGRQGEQPRFTISPETLDAVPSVALASDFTGRSLDQRRLGQSPTSNHYGRHERGTLRWGGDVVLEAERAQRQRAPERRSQPRDGNAYSYDDGYDPSLWTRRASAPARRPSAVTHYAGVPGIAYEDAATLREDRRPPREPSEHYGGLTIEDGAQAWKQQIGRPLAPAITPATASYGGAMPGVAAQVIEDGAQARALGRIARIEPAPRRSSGYGGHAESYGGHPTQQVSGYEDAVALRRSVGAQGLARGREPRSNHGRRERGDAGDDSSSASRIGAGRHVDYDERPSEQSLPVGPAATPLGEEPPPRDAPQTPAPASAQPSGPALTIADKVRILRVVGRAESGEAGYAATLADVEFNDPDHPYHHRRHVGLSWGLLAFTQRSGVLGRVLALAKVREQQLRESGELTEELRFDRLFGERWSELLERTDETRTPDPEQRLQPVDGA
ncbi:MAG: hypothetical protein KC431_23910, partial [Myxococcales bacterium]|nr:hypothetical protein [Myxococcales bacterium]